MAFNVIILENIDDDSVHESYRCSRVPIYAWWVFNTNSVAREYGTWHSRRAIHHLSSIVMSSDRETRCSNAFLTVASKRTYISFRHAISLRSLFHRPCPLHDDNYTVGSEKPLAKYTSAVCDRSKSKRFFTNSFVPATILDEKSRYMSRHLQLIAYVASNCNRIIR